MTAALDLAGLRFGRLVAIKRHATINGKAHWLCRCDCGQQSTPEVSSLRRGLTTSCGCGVHPKTHGLTKSSEYKVWKSMIARCKRDPLYLAKGISVCERWGRSFEDFAADMGKRPSRAHSIDRIDNDGCYTLSNCRWATSVTQQRNKSTNVLVTIDGVTDCVAGWAERLGIPRHRISNAVCKRGITHEMYIRKALAAAARRLKGARHD